MCNGDDLQLNPLFNFEPIKGLEHWEDVRMFRGGGEEQQREVHFEYVDS